MLFRCRSGKPFFFAHPCFGLWKFSPFEVGNLHGKDEGQDSFSFGNLLFNSLINSRIKPLSKEDGSEGWFWHDIGTTSIDSHKGVSTFKPFN